MDWAYEIKQRISTPEVFSYYGYERDRNGFVCCPFHEENHASMKVYDGDRGYHCFGGCGAHGDIITFVINLFSISFKEAISKLNLDFMLGLPIGQELSPDQKMKMEYESRLRQKKIAAEKVVLNSLNRDYEKAYDEWARLDLQLIKYAPKNPFDGLHELYVEAISKIDYAAYVLQQAENARDEYERSKREKKYS